MSQRLLSKIVGVLEIDQVLHGEMKERIRTSYYDRLKKLLKSKLNAGNLVKAIKGPSKNPFRHG